MKASVCLTAIAGVLVLNGCAGAATTLTPEEITALEKSEKPPSTAVLRRAFRLAGGEAALRLLALLFEQEDETLPTALLAGFSGRSEKERVGILTSVAGHCDESTLELVKLGMKDKSETVQQAALMRLLSFRASTALPLLDEYAKPAPLKTPPLVGPVKDEMRKRQLFPFMKDTAEGNVAALETIFPSKNGTVPMVSPDGKWVAYVETGWGWGGFVSMGRSSMASLVRVTRVDGRGGRPVSDLFLVGWMADSRRLASCRDGYAVICDLDGEVVVEFGEKLGPSWQKYADQRADWTKRDAKRKDYGMRMPKRKALPRIGDVYGDGLRENAAFSPDGDWFGPFRDKGGYAFIGPAGERKAIQVPEGVRPTIMQATWSPDGKNVVLIGRSGQDALIVDARTGRTTGIENVDPIPRFDSGWHYRKCRWNPWAKDGTQLAFVRSDQIWISAPDGNGARQLTFDGTRKAFPTFSRNGKRIAYVTWQPDMREHYARTGPTDLWVVDIGTRLSARVTAPAVGRIHCLDWLDDDTLIFDRLDPKVGLGFWSSLKRLQLGKAAAATSQGVRR